ncbi:MAG: PAS domain S-box protein [Magnetospirillum sp.]|nr:PAS domain S-box protein [Magnetospirillum sp.]
MDSGRSAGIGVDLPVESHSQRPRRARMTLHWAMVGLYSLMLLLFGGFSTWDDYQTSLRGAELNTANYVRLLEEHAKRTLEAGDMLLQRLLDRVAVKGAQGVAASREDWQALAEAAAGSPQTGALFLLDARGEVLFNTRGFPAAPGANLADRDFFRAVAEGAAEPYVALSFYEPGTGKPSFAIARRIQGPDGSFAGVAVATIESDYFKAFYGELGFSEHVAFGVYKHDGAILVRQPMAAEDIGRKIPANAPLLKLMPTQPVGIYRAVSTYDALNRIVAYRKSEAPAIVAWVATTEEDALAGWWQRLARNSALAVASIVVMAGLSLAVLRGIHREERAATALSALFDLSPLGMIRSDMEGRILAANRAFIDMLGYPAAELTTLSHREITPASFAGEDRRQWQSLSAQGRYGPYEKEYIHRDGRRLAVRLNGARVSDGDETYSWTIVEDITDRLAAENALRERTDQLARSNAELEQFAYVASHDLREPLRMVTSYVTLLERRYGDLLGPDGRDFVGFARDGALRMNRLILNLLEFSRIGRDHQAFTPVALSEVVAAAVEDLGVTITEAEATVTVEGDLPVVSGNAEELTRLFENLIGNAVKYRRPGEKPAVRIAAKPEKSGWWQLIVSDNGIGIEPEYHRRIFQIFQRLHGRDQYEGTGIGLAMCKKIVEHHGGCIWVESQHDRGCSFNFNLPATSLGE